MYAIDIPHFYELVYTEGDRRLRIEIDFREPVPCISRRTIVAWDPPHEREAIDAARREEIIRRVKEFLITAKAYPLGRRRGLTPHTDPRQSAPRQARVALSG